MLSRILAEMWLPLLLGAAFQICEMAIGLKPKADAATARDRGSAAFLMLASQGGSLSAYAYVALRGMSHDIELPMAVRIAGAIITITGLVIRVWSARTLGAFFTRRVRVAEEQHVVETGPYRLVRHPAYTGFLLVGLGIGLALGSVVALVLLFVPTLVATMYRVVVEEAALCEGLGEPYAAYMKRTKRFIPHVY